MQSKEFFVLDVNIVISAMMRIGNSLAIFLKNFDKNRFDFITPNFFLVELNKHTERIMKKTRFSSEEILEISDFIASQIVFIQDEEFVYRIKEAQEILKGHEKDVPYLALALAFNCKIFSGDKALKKIIPSKIVTPKELLERF